MQYTPMNLKGFAPSFILSFSLFGATSLTLALSPSPPKSGELSLYGKSTNNQIFEKLRDLVGDIRRRGETPPMDNAGSTTSATETPVLRNLHTLQGMMFSGSLLPNTRSLFAGGFEAYSNGWRAVQQVFHKEDLLALAMISFLSIHFMRLCHKIYYKITTKLIKSKEHKEFEKSKLSAVGKFFSQGGQIASLVYVMELVTTFVLNVLAASAPAKAAAKNAAQASLPKNLLPLAKFPGLFANFAYGFWLAKHTARLKSKLLSQIYRKIPDPETYDSLLNFLIYIIASILILEASAFDLGAIVKSLVAVGGLSSIVVGLAFKDPASQMLQGAIMMAANKYHRNESIRLGDGTQGKVVDIGLLETTMMGGDDILFKIPHSKLFGQKFSNISRMKRSQTKFELRFHLYDMHRVQDIATAIKHELVQACPKLIKDGSRPFRVIWTDIGTDHFVVTVDAHHDVPPACNAYWETREKVLLSISKAIKSVNVKFAMPVTVHAKFGGESS